MDRLPTLLALLALGALLLVQARRLRAAAASRRLARAGALDAALPLLRDPRRRLEPDGLPRLTGTRRGAVVDLRVTADTLTPRKLPTLWLMATLPEPQPVAATWHLMLRPRGTETFSAYGRLPEALAVPPGLPEDAGLRTDDPARALPPGVARALGAAVARTGEARLKEVVVSPRGLRLTWLAEEADRGRYLAFRDAEMAREPIPEAALAALLDSLLALRDDLAPPLGSAA